MQDVNSLPPETEGRLTEALILNSYHVNIPL